MFLQFWQVTLTKAHYRSGGILLGALDLAVPAIIVDASKLTQFRAPGGTKLSKRSYLGASDADVCGRLRTNVRTF